MTVTELLIFSVGVIVGFALRRFLDRVQPTGVTGAVWICERCDFQQQNDAPCERCGHKRNGGTT